MIRQKEESKDRIRYGSTDIDYYIRNIVRDKAEWILRKQKQLKSSVPEIEKPTFKEDSTLPYLGKNYPLRINKNQSRNNLTFSGEEFIAGIRGPKNDEGAMLRIKHLYEERILGMGYSILKPKVTPRN